MYSVDFDDSLMYFYMVYKQKNNILGESLLRVMLRLSENEHLRPIGMFQSDLSQTPKHN